MKNYACFKRIVAILAIGCCAVFAQTTTPRDSVTFYFLPPNDVNWIGGNSYIYDDDTQTAELMQVDASRCGWFKKTYSSVARVPEKVMMYLGSQGRYKLDTNGVADLLSPAWIPLRAKFGTSSALYFIADNLQFTTTRPNNLDEEGQGRCTYKMAAFIYDTDNSVNPSFSGIYTDPGANNNGIRRGIVAPTLLDTQIVGTDTLIKKPTFLSAKARWVDAESFNAAFTPKGLYKGKISNIPRCYDMPFSRAANGTWEFDSDGTRTPTGNNLVGGFYPYILDKAYNKDEDGSDADYSDCPACNSEYRAECFNLLSTSSLNNLAPVTYKGVTYRGVDAFDRTYFPDGTTHHNYYGNTRGCATPSPGYTNTTKGTANLSFCFESHSEFVYDKGQEFFFRGDDDIWIFINNKLVIDLGGIHMPAPGYVDLDTIKNPALVEGETYPIDVFFCERMGTQSNVRVSTNMYIKQKSSFYNSPEGRDGNWMCVVQTGKDNTCSERISNAGGGSTQKLICGEDLKGAGYRMDYYMIKRGSPDTLWLSGTKNPSKCVGNDEKFTCFKKDGEEDGGIRVDSLGGVYFCGGYQACKSKPAAAAKVDVPSGSYIIYARLMQGNKIAQGTKPIILDELKSSTNARMVWGNLNNENGTSPKVLRNAYGELTKMEQSIIAEKRTPIYIAGGKWADTVSYNSFVYESDSDLVVNIKYLLSGATGLKISLDSLGEKEVEWPRSMPASGIDTLWVMGTFSMGEKTFEINLEGLSNTERTTPSLKLTVYQPKLRFTVDSVSTTPINPATPSIASGFVRWTGDPTAPPYVGRALELYVMAWDSLRNVICSHCDFVLRETSSTNNDDINDRWPEIIVQSNAGKMSGGKQTILIRGRDEVIDTNFAKWRVYGPSEGSTFAEWTLLQFKEAPIPMPLNSYVYDRNGDGIGDSLLIKFTKPFTNNNGEVIDSLLPVLLEVTWEKGNTIAYHLDGHTVKDLRDPSYIKKNYNKAFFTANYEYWKRYISLKDTAIIIADSITAFSKNILTTGYNSGKGKLLSYTPYYKEDDCTAGICTIDKLKFDAFEASVLDRIPPIVVKAEYKMMDKGKNCMEKSPGCRESIVIQLSEPVFAAPNAADDPLLVKNPFSYCFQYSQHSKCLPEGATIDKSNLKWNNIGLNNYKKWDWELPAEKNKEDVSHSVTYKPNSKKPYPKEYYEGVTKGDSTVDLIYYSYKVGDGTTRMPKATDWVKIRPPASAKDRGGVDVFWDAEGNTANPREIGVLISGENNSSKQQVKIAVIDPEISPEDPLSTIGGTFVGERDKERYYPRWINKEAQKYGRDSLYLSGNVSEFLPLPPSLAPNGHPKFTNADTVKAYYPGSVGTIFDVYRTIDKKAQAIWEYCKVEKCRTKDGKLITKMEDIASLITIHANVYYHTNIGDYTAHRDPLVAKCTDPIFKRDDPFDSGKGNNCWGNENNLYLAWNLKTNKNRYVGVGAYVAITKFYLQIEYRNSSDNLVSEKFNQEEFVEMFGVRRGK